MRRPKEDLKVNAASGNKFIKAMTGGRNFDQEVFDLNNRNNPDKDGQGKIDS